MENIYLLLSLCAGCFIVLQRNVNMRLAKNVGLVGSNLINYLIGGIFAGLIYFAVSCLGMVNKVHFGGFHYALIIAAVCGITIVLLSNWLVPKVTAIAFTVFTLIGQCTSSLIFDIIIYKKEITMTNVIGAVIVIIGVMLYNWDHRKEES
ncbi:MAG: DMT family transporter [Peptostreptococcaceae bacterium]|nr:DMT family transporter [Peptostreptococcaceae bacterium]